MVGRRRARNTGNDTLYSERNRVWVCSVLQKKRRVKTIETSPSGRICLQCQGACGIPFPSDAPGAKLTHCHEAMRQIWPETPLGLQLLGLWAVRPWGPPIWHTVVHVCTVDRRMDWRNACFQSLMYIYSPNLPCTWHVATAREKAAFPLP